MAITAWCSRWRYEVGVSPTISVNRELNEPSDVQPTVMHASVTTHPLAQQRHGALDAPGHQVGVRRLAVGGTELAREVCGRHQRMRREGRHIEGARVLPVDQVTSPAQVREVGELLGRHATTVSRRSCQHVDAEAGRYAFRTDECRAVGPGARENKSMCCESWAHQSSRPSAHRSRTAHRPRYRHHATIVAGRHRSSVNRTLACGRCGASRSAQSSSPRGTCGSMSTGVVACATITRSQLRSERNSEANTYSTDASYVDVHRPADRTDCSAVRNHCLRPGQAMRGRLLRVRPDLNDSVRVWYGHRHRPPAYQTRTDTLASGVLSILGP